MTDIDMEDRPMPLFLRVRDRLRADEDILALADTEFLEVELTEAVRANDTHERPPRHCLAAVTLFVKELGSAVAEVADSPIVTELVDPNGFYEFQASDNYIVAYCGCHPVWFWKRDGGEWKLHRVSVQRRSSIADVFEDVYPYLFANVPQSELSGVFLRSGVNDPERLIPHALLGVLAYIWEMQNRAHDRMIKADAPYLPDVEGVDQDFRFKTDGEFIVTYRRGSDNPLWCWKRREANRWKLYRLFPSEGFELLPGEAPDLLFCSVITTCMKANGTEVEHETTGPVVAHARCHYCLE